MTKTRTYRLLTGKHGRFEGKSSVVYRKGDLIALTDAEAAYLGKRVELAEGESAPEPLQEPATKTLRIPPAADKPLGLADVNMPDAVFLIAKLESSEALDAAGEEEKAGKDRKGVHEAIAERWAELEG